MKIRKGFVSNSSSSSFIINKKDVNEEQSEKIKNHIEVARKMTEDNPGKYNGYGYDEEYSNFGFMGKEDKWNIKFLKHHILLETDMTNFDMEYFLESIGISLTEKKHYDSYRLSNIIDVPETEEEIISNATNERCCVIVEDGFIIGLKKWVKENRSDIYEKNKILFGVE